MEAHRKLLISQQLTQGFRVLHRVALGFCHGSFQRDCHMCGVRAADWRGPELSAPPRCTVGASGISRRQRTRGFLGHKNCVASHGLRPRGDGACSAVAQGQLVGVALSFLRNFGVLSGASGVLGRLSASVAALGGGGPGAAEERLQSRQVRPSPVLQTLNQVKLIFFLG